MYEVWHVTSTSRGRIGVLEAQHIEDAKFQVLKSYPQYLDMNSTYQDHAFLDHYEPCGVCKEHCEDCSNWEYLLIEKVQ